ncbi:MAG: cytochrome b/b6 domain-containing protein [Pseudomonadota bacterium]
MKGLYLYSLWVRIWHWLNALSCVILLLSGMSLHFSNRHDPIVSFDTSMIVHNIAGIAMALLYVVFLIGNIISSNGVHYKVKIKGYINRLIKQVIYYGVGIFKGEPHPFPATQTCKFNPMQQVAYVGVMYGLVSALVLSGVMLLFPESIPDNLFGAGTILPIALAHTLLSYFLALFLIGHLYLATTGHTPLSNYKTMITGVHLEHQTDELEGTAK